MKKKQRKKVFGVGVNDCMDGVMGVDGKLKPCYRHWYNMLARCYNEKTKQKAPHCEGCEVCDEWKWFSNFKEWFDEHYVEGWQLDKDILVKYNRVYSPQTCCFVPQEINSLFTKRTRDRGLYPIGVYYDSKGWRKRFVARVVVEGKIKFIGHYFTPEEAFLAYKEKKELNIKQVADRYKEQIESRVYEAMYNYEVEITD